MARLIPSTAEAAAHLTERMDTLILTAERENRALSDAENTELTGLMARAKKAVEVAEERRSFTDAFARTLGTPSSSDTVGSLARTANGSTRETRTLLPSGSEYRAVLAEGSDPLGGYLVPELIARDVIDRLRPVSLFLNAGARLYTMTSDVLRLPMIATSASVAMVEENAQIPESNQTFGEAALVARKLAALVRASSEVLADAAPDLRASISDDIIKEMAQKLDAQIIAGSGVAPNLLGLTLAPGVNATAIGGLITLDAIAAAITRLQTDNATPTGIFMHPAAWGTLRVAKDSGQGYYLTPTPDVAAREQLFGVKVFVTPAMGNVVLVADMSSVAIGVRDYWQVLYDRSRFLEFDQVAIRVTARFASAVVHPAGLELLTGVTI